MASNLKERWYKALADENCKVVTELLTKDPSLLNEGWKADRKASGKFNLERSWKGRTALHVAARRGDAKLTKRILNSESLRIREAKVEKSPLLEVVDGNYDLDALAMAVVNGNGEIVSLLNKTSLEIPETPYDMSPKALAESNKNNRALKEISEKVLRSYEYTQIKHEYDEDCDFNFLPFYEYLFHFTFSTRKPTANLDFLMKRIREDILSGAKLDQGLLHYLFFDLWDGQGRTPLHVAVDSDTVDCFCELIAPDDASISRSTHEKLLNQPDSAGRTPLYRAAAKNQLNAVEELLNDARTKVGAKVTFEASQWGADLDIDRLSRRNGFKGGAVYILEKNLRRKGFNHKSNVKASVKPLTEVHSTALHVAIIHKHRDIVEKLLKHDLGRKKDHGEDICERRVTWPVLRVSKDQITKHDNCSPGKKTFTTKNDTMHYCTTAVSTMELAVLVGSIPTLQQLLQANGKRTNDFSQKAEDVEASFLLAAASGNPGMIKAFLGSQKRKFDPLIEDSFGNTALHHALKGTTVQFHPHLVDFVGFDHVCSWRWANSDWISGWLENPEESSSEPEESGSEREESSSEPKTTRKIEKSDIEKNYGKRKACIDLLLQAGIDIWKKNDDERTASPDPDAPDDFISWWYDKVAEQTEQVQKKLNDAANAISVTAALVATASYVGPLQPPLGYSQIAPLDVIQVDHMTVRIYVVCDCLSFYLALAAIILTLAPWMQSNWPFPQESKVMEMRRTSIIVAVSATFLFPSLLFVLMAFASGYIAVIPDDGLARGGVGVAATVFGGSLVFAVILWFVFYTVWRNILKPLKRKQARTLKRKYSRGLSLQSV